MLIYDPASDINHFVFRLIKILSRSPIDEFEFDRYRILDFYLLFPTALEDFSAPKDVSSSVKKAVKSYKSRYNTIHDKKLQFNATFDLQKIATRYLASIGILDRKKLDQNILMFSRENLPDQLHIIKPPLSNDIASLENFLLRDSYKIDLLGQFGLKARSGLIEYKYDSI